MMIDIHLSAPIPITKTHEITLFDCGVHSLNHWLKKWAIKKDCSESSRTYVISNGQTVIAYYCLGMGVIGRTETPKTHGRNLSDLIPILVLNRLAVHKDYHNQGIGRALLRDAVLRSLQASKIAGVSALLVHALSEEAKRFYLSSGFRESPMGPRVLYL